MGKTFYLISGLVLVVVSGFGGYFVASSKVSSPPVKQPAQVAQNASKNVAGSSIIKQQTATVQGKITSVAGKTITVVDDKNQSDQFSLSDKLVVYKPINTSGQAGASTDLKDIKTDALAFIVLELTDGSYQVVSISYPPDVSTLPTPPALPAAPTAGR